MKDYEDQQNVNGPINEKLETDRSCLSQLHRRGRRPNVQINEKEVMKRKGLLIVPPREETLSKQRGPASLRKPRQVATEDEHTMVQGLKGVRLFVSR